ncbi:hypothetical protein ANI02nite_26420 [Acetobacter nitrogenifigens DSM 23921 = NBRC 105050]|uniref:Uncharacterized protein n=1 Tax=Acetobacter nitrogenifigens DSM 23921 = NBRC 105050 TaxID=1120919 RepID=A0A511XCR5_9PROT|nr:hypothetical protein ANI02nite_26420 [Acetobacter nitrogenifigens DSM 23921 = NBRC 105050]
MHPAVSVRRRIKARITTPVVYPRSAAIIAHSRAPHWRTHRGWRRRTEPARTSAMPPMVGTGAAA